MTPAVAAALSVELERALSTPPPTLTLCPPRPETSGRVRRRGAEAGRPVKSKVNAWAWGREDLGEPSYTAPSPHERMDALPVLRTRFLELVQRTAANLLLTDEDRDAVRDLAFKEVADALTQQPEGGQWDAKKVSEALGFKPVASEGYRQWITRRNCERFCRALSIPPHEIEGL